MKLLSVDAMREVERQADAAGLSYAEMMQRAGQGLAGLVEEVYGMLEDRVALGLAGAGNNGGDVLVALAALAEAGWDTRAYLSKPRPEGDGLVKNARDAGCQILLMNEDADFKLLDDGLERSSVLLDGLLGTGFEMPLKPDLAGLMQHITNRSLIPHVVAVDCPSGVNCETGAAAAEVIPAEFTVCMGAVKRGLLQFPAFGLAGELEVVPLGFTDELPAWKEARDVVVTESLAGQWLPERPLDAHKGSFGSTVLAAGSVNFTGAALLAGRAALRSGVGLVKMAVPGSLYPVLAGHLPEATWVLLPHEMGVISHGAVEVVFKELKGAESLLLGCGWGREETTAEFLKFLLIHKVNRTQKAAIGFVSARREETPHSEPSLPPLVLDADGLRLLAKIEDWHQLLPQGTVLTPHPGELAELAGVSVEEVQRERIEIAKRLAKAWKVVLVLKGALTVIADISGNVRVIPVATSALAHAGTGDVLAGLIAGLLAQGVAAFDAASLGCWIHAQAGLIAEEWAGHPAAVIAGDVVDAIGEVMQQLASTCN